MAGINPYFRPHSTPLLIIITGKYYAIINTGCILHLRPDETLRGQHPLLWNEETRLVSHSLIPHRLRKPDMPEFVLVQAGVPGISQVEPAKYRTRDATEIPGNIDYVHLREV